jgi:hypothetical protein
MRKLLMALLFASTTVACSGDDPTVVEDLTDTGSDETLVDSSTTETIDNDTGSTTDDTGSSTDDTGTPTEGGADTGTPGDTSTPADTGVKPDVAPDVVADTAVAPDVGSDTRVDATPDSIVPDVAVVCGTVSCTTDAQCALVGCGTCRMSGKCGM